MTGKLFAFSFQQGGRQTIYGAMDGRGLYEVCVRQRGGGRRTIEDAIFPLAEGQTIETWAKEVLQLNGIVQAYHDE